MSSDETEPLEPSQDTPFNGEGWEGRRCAGCRGPIEDRYLLQVTEAAYHERCLRCAACAAPLAGSCYARGSNLYCRLDYDRLFGRRCAGCAERVGAGELVMRARAEDGQVFHVRCFQCVVCGAQLRKGDHFVLKQGQLFCRPDYEKELEMFAALPHGYEEGGSGEETGGGKRDGRKGPKRPRTILTTQQRRAFKASFEVSPKPCRKVRESLARDTGLSVRIVQVWFQNQRAKMKKMQKKVKTEAKGSPADPDTEVRLDKLKEEDHSSQGSAYSSYAGQGRFGSPEEGAEAAFYRHVLAAQPFPGAHPYPDADGRPESCGHLGQQPANPIDRLYSMQTAYFCPEDDPPSAYPPT